MRPAARQPQHSSSDIFATALNRYAASYLTFGGLALLVAVLPVTAVAAARGADARPVIVSTLGLAVSAYAFLVLCGLVTASIGGRTRETLLRVVGAALLVWPAFAIVLAALQLVGIAALPVLLVPLALAPVAAGAGDGSPLAAVRRALVLVRGSYRRSLVVSALAVLGGTFIYLALYLALSPVPRDVRVGVTLVLWAVITWPIAALVMRSLYGALTGRLVVRLRDAAELPSADSTTPPLGA